MRAMWFILVLAACSPAAPPAHAPEPAPGSSIQEDPAVPSDFPPLPPGDAV